MNLKILFHDNCFDGAASAALFARFYRERVRADASIAFRGVQHKAGNPFGPGAFDGDENACVDFRYSRDPRLTWWFDHHLSTFSTLEDRAHFEALGNTQHHYDPRARSNTKFQARVLKERFGFDTEPLAELIEWAEVIDGAQFGSAERAVALAEPALKLMTWVENNRDFALTLRFLDDLQQRSLAEIADQSYVREPLVEILRRHQRNIDVIDRRASDDDGIVYYDLIEDGIDAHNKFIAYMLYPDCRYTVGVTGTKRRTKILVGANPWSPRPRPHNIASICERYGGGGHSVVGGISFFPAQPARTRQVAQEIVCALKQNP